MIKEMSWLDELYNKLAKPIEDHQSAHALLIQGDQGIGKAKLALSLTASFLAENIDLDEEDINEGKVPDCKLINPDEGKEIISIDQIRSLKSFMLLTSLKGKGKVAVINPAHAMNRAAANSLLKILEEPPQNTLIILISEPNNNLPKTIISRVQIIKVNRPTREETLNWLSAINPEQSWAQIIDIFGSRPILLNDLGFEYLNSQIQQVAKDLENLLTKKIKPSALAGSWKSEDLETNLRILYFWFSKFLYHNLLQEGESNLLPDSLNQLLKLDLNAEESFTFLKEVASIRKYKIEGRTLNWSLQITNLLSPMYSNLKGLQNNEPRNQTY